MFNCDFGIDYNLLHMHWKCLCDEIRQYLNI